MKELFLTLMLVVVLMVAGGPSVLAEAPQQIDSAVSHTMINPCNGDTIRFSGSLHHVIRKTADPRGSRITMGGNTQDVSGLDAKGIQYRLARANDSTILNPGSRSQVTVTEDAPVLVQGTGPDFLLHLTLRITFGEDEKLAVMVDRLSGDCRDVPATASSGVLPIEATAAG
jgi:hypothetical protein